jgi:peptidyl-prolyl cis-trans isomerase SurA
LNQAFASMASGQRITPQQFVQFLQRAGISPDTVKARIKAEITWGQLVRGKFAASLQIGESDVAKELGASNEAADVGYVYTLYPVIVVVPRGSDAGLVEGKRREAEQLRSRFLNCKQGLDFARALRDVAVRGQITRSSADLPQTLRDLLGSIEIGRLTAPEVTAEGIQMFAVCDKKASKGDSPAERKLRNTLFQQRFERESKRYLDELRKAAMIEYKDAKDTKTR